MSATRRKRIVLVASGTLGAVALYVGAYYACVSVQFQRGLAFKEPSIESAYAYYRIGEQWQDFAQSFFEPARLLDAYYFRPDLWKDKVYKPGQ